MKFREIFRFEFVYQARRVRTWLYFAVLFVVAYLLTRNAWRRRVAIPQFAIAHGRHVLSRPALASDGPCRGRQCGGARRADADASSRLHHSHQQGRLPWRAISRGVCPQRVDPARRAAGHPGRPARVLAWNPRSLVRFRPAVYLSAYGVLALPTAFTFTAVQFSLAALKRRAVVSYLGSCAVLRHCWRRGWRGDQRSSMPTLGKLLDPTPHHSCHHPGHIDTAREECRSVRTGELDARESTPMDRRRFGHTRIHPSSAFDSVTGQA